jgi:hypothetical protein
MLYAASFSKTAQNSLSCRVKWDKKFIAYALFQKEKVVGAVRGSIVIATILVIRKIGKTA